MTGDVDAYLLYKQTGKGETGEPDAGGEEADEEDTDLINF
jgi:hypothetical protein